MHLFWGGHNLRLGLMHLIQHTEMGKLQEMEYVGAALKGKAKQAKSSGLWCRKEGVNVDKLQTQGHVSKRSWGQQDMPPSSCWCLGQGRTNFLLSPWFRPTPSRHYIWESSSSFEAHTIHPHYLLVALGARVWLWLYFKFFFIVK